LPSPRYDGLVVSQFLTLYITPVIYVYMERLRGNKRARGPASLPQRDETLARV
jgi:hypothetical protein